MRWDQSPCSAPCLPKARCIPPATSSTPRWAHPLLLLLVTPTPTSTGRSASRRAAQCLTAPIKSPGRYDITMHPVEPGFVIAEGLDDRLGEVDATTAVHVQRPGQIWVAPGAELMQIHDYVSEVVIPTLRTGGVASPNLPRQVRLGDTGDTDEQRIEAGGDIPAHIRCGREALAPAREVMAGACRCCRHLRAGIKPASATAAGTPPGPAA